MNKLWRWWGRVVAASVLTATGLVASSCSTQSHEGTNTNWVTCTRDVDCNAMNATPICKGGRCVAETTIEREAGTDSGSGGTPGELLPDTGPPQDVCVQGRIFDPCQPGSIQCIPDFRAVRYRYLPCSTSDAEAPYVVQCGAYDELIWSGLDIGDTYYFDRTSGHLAGVSHFGLTTRPACEYYDPGFRVPTCFGTPQCMGSRRAAVGRLYDAANDCYGKEVAIGPVFLRETEPDTTSGVSEMTCFVDPNGAHYAVWKGFTEAVEITGQPNAPLTWSVRGDQGLFVSPVSDDPECVRAITRGHFDTRGGLGDGHLMASRPDGGGTTEGGTYAGECP